MPTPLESFTAGNQNSKEHTRAEGDTQGLEGMDLDGVTGGSGAFHSFLADVVQSFPVGIQCGGKTVAGGHGSFLSSFTSGVD
jgi:hypothetical protein